MIRRSRAGLKRLFAPCMTMLIVLLWPLQVHTAESVCYGTPGKGRLEGAVRIPEAGANFVPYSSLGVGLGRTYVHAKVERVTADAYSTLAKRKPGKIFMYGESGWASGGRIKPHRTHQNGLSVDFMVPVVDATGKSVPLPAGPGNKFGYGIEFDDSGRYDGLSMDFDAIAAHLYELHVAAKRNGISISRVIFEHAYIPKLHATEHGAFIKQHITFMKGQAWVRHDEHYHVDFSTPCKPL